MTLRYRNMLNIPRKVQHSSIFLPLKYSKVKVHSRFFFTVGTQPKYSKVQVHSRFFFTVGTQPINYIRCPGNYYFNRSRYLARYLLLVQFA